MLPSLPFLFGPAYLLTNLLGLENSYLFKPHYWYKKTSNRVQMRFKNIKQPWPGSSRFNSRNYTAFSSFKKSNLNPTKKSPQIYRGNITTNVIQRYKYWGKILSVFLGSRSRNKKQILFDKKKKLSRAGSKEKKKRNKKRFFKGEHTKKRKKERIH